MTRPIIRFPGQYFDAETGLHYNRFRYYDPGIGRYVSADPIGQFGILDRMGISLVGRPPLSPAAAPNLFSYSLNNPVGWADPDGLGPIGTAVCIVAQAANAASTIADFVELTEKLEALQEDLEEADEICFPDEASKLEYKAEIEKEILRVLAERTASLVRGSAIGLGVTAVCVPLEPIRKPLQLEA